MDVAVDVSVDAARLGMGHTAAFEAFQREGGWIDDGDSGARFYLEGRLQAYIKLQGGPASTSGSYHRDFRRAGGIRRAMSQTALKHGCTAYGMMGRRLYPLEAHLGNPPARADTR